MCKGIFGFGSRESNIGYMWTGHEQVLTVTLKMIVQAKQAYHELLQLQIRVNKYFKSLIKN